jgi:hypothetical protein
VFANGTLKQKKFMRFWGLIEDSKDGFERQNPSGINKRGIYVDQVFFGLVLMDGIFFLLKL